MAQTKRNSSVQGTVGNTTFYEPGDDCGMKTKSAAGKSITPCGVGEVFS